MPAADICFLSSAHPIDDKRVFQKEAISLAEAGWSVVHVAPGANDRHWTSDGVELITYAAGRGKLGRLRRLPTLYRAGRRTSAWAYHCNEVDSWIVGLLLRRRGTRIVFDVHEHYPPGIVRWLPRPLHRVGEWAVRLLLQMLSLLTHKLVLAKQSVADDYSWARRRQVVVGNESRARGTPEPTQNHTDRRLRVVHSGVLSRPRGCMVLAEALGAVVAQGHDVEVVIVGGFNDTSEPDFDRRTQELGVADRVTKCGWVPYEEAATVVRSCHVGVVLFTKTEENNVRAMPHKMFDYMLAGLAVVAPSFAPDVVTILTAAECALLVDTDDAVAVTEALGKLAADRALLARLAANGRAAALDRYSWERESEKLLAVYRELLSEA